MATQRFCLVLLAWSSECETTLDIFYGVDEVKVSGEDGEGEMGMQALRRVFGE
jgi:hypothetical protein